MRAAFTGKLYLDGRRASMEECNIMAEKMALPPGASKMMQIHGPLALAAAVPPLASRVEDAIDISDDGDKLLIGAGSLYNRRELVDKLACDDTAGDLDLMSRALKRWGSKGLQYLDGDWMLAAYDGADETLLLARSWGYSALYYYRGAGFIAFASHPVSLTSLPGIPARPAVPNITQTLCGVVRRPELTDWDEIKQVQPAAVLKSVRGKIREEIWWRPSQIDTRSVSRQQEAGLLEEFVHLYREAVRKRLPLSGNTAATLSSGLDSTSVCLLAAREMALSGKTLNALTWVPQYPDEAYSFGNWLSDESDLACRAVEGTSNIIHDLLDASGENPIDAIRKQIMHRGSPLTTSANLYWIDHLLTRAASASCEVLLTGQFGNATVSWSPHEISMWPKNQFFPETGTRQYLRIVRNKARYDIERVRNQRRDAGVYPLLNPSYPVSKEFKQIITPREKAMYDHSSMVELNMGLFDTWYHKFFWSGVEMRDPTMDMKLAAFLLSLPDNMFFRDRMNRRVIRLGMQGIVPEKILLNRRRGQQGSDLVPRIREFGESAEQALLFIKASELARHLLNVQQMDRVLQEIRRGKTGPEMLRHCFRYLTPGLSVGLFLAHFDTGYNWSESLQ